MKEFIEKLIGRLEEIYNRNDKAKKKAYEEQDWEYFDIFTHRNEGVYTSISIVNQLAEEYKGGWIPCSEKLPESGVHVLCYGKNSLGSFKYEVSVYAEEIECWMCSKIADVIAWQPLPAPYENSV